MDRSLFEIIDFTQPDFPPYPCPRCGSHLEVTEFSSENSAETRIASKDDPSFDSEWVLMGFRADLVCTSARCRERVLCVGTGVVDRVYDEGKYGWEEHYEDRWSPEFFTPALRVFQIPPNTPNTVASSLTASFRALFLGSGSALNEVRNALEFLMDELKVPRKSSDNRALPLHSRVQLMPQDHQQYANQLLAVKWLGNAGTHAQKTVRNDVLDAYEILHHVLESMFSGKTDRLQRMVDSINSQKAPIRDC